MVVGWCGVTPATSPYSHVPRSSALMRGSMLRRAKGLVGLSRRADPPWGGVFGRLLIGCSMKTGPNEATYRKHTGYPCPIQMLDATVENVIDLCQEGSPSRPR